MTRDRKKNEYTLLKLLSEGKVLQASVPESRYADLVARGLSRNAIRYIRELEAEGIIVGYAPILSERGMEYFKGLAAVYGVEKEKEEGQIPDAV